MRKNAQAGEGPREGDTEFCAIGTEPDAGLELTSPEIMTCAEIESRMLNRLSHPGAPAQLEFLMLPEILLAEIFFFLKILFSGNLYTQRGAQTHNLEIKSRRLHRRSQPGAPMAENLLLLFSTCGHHEVSHRVIDHNLKVRTTPDG